MLESILFFLFYFAYFIKVRTFAVFFIVLDLRLTKGWSKALLLFYVLMFHALLKRFSYMK